MILLHMSEGWWNKMSNTSAEFKEEFEDGDWDSEYADYIMDNCGGERIICNGDTLIEAMEDFYLADEFVESMRHNFEK